VEGFDYTSFEDGMYPALPIFERDVVTRQFSGPFPYYDIDWPGWIYRPQVMKSFDGKRDGR
jgi:hypothetical protein